MISLILRISVTVCFLIVTMMFIGKSCVHSPLFRYFNTKKDLLKRARRLNEVRYQLAMDYFNAHMPTFISELKQNECGNEKLDIAVVIVTVARTERSANNHNGYLVQTAAWMDKLLKMKTATMDTMLVVCNAETRPERHKDAIYLQKYIPYINRGGSNIISVDLTHTPKLRNSTLIDLKRKHEIEDYVFCLNASRYIKSEYTLVIEDDVLPEKDMLQVVEHTLKRRFKQRTDKKFTFQDKFTFIKLYYPEKWQGFALECERLAELCSVGFVGGMFFVVCLDAVRVYCCFVRRIRLSVKQYLLGVSLCITLAELVGRITLMELRRASPWLYVAGPSRASNTQAMLFQTSMLEGLCSFLLDKTSLNKDLAIHDFSVKTNGLSGYQLEPNLFRHTGMHTSLYAHAAPEDPRDYIFDIPFTLTH